MAKKPAVRTKEEQSEAEDLIKNVLGSVTSYFEQTRDHRAKVLEDFYFNEGGERQWDPKDVAKLRADERPVLSFNVSGPIVNFIAGYQAEREQDYRAFPRGTDDEQLGRLMTAQMKYAVDMTRGSHALHQGFRKGIIGGQSVFEVGHSFDYTDDLLNGDIKLDVLEHNTWYYEPGARRYDRADAQHQGKLIWMTPLEAKRKWPAHAASLERGLNKDWLKEDPLLTGVPQHILEQLVDYEHGRIRILQHWYRVPVEVALVVDLRTGDVRRMDNEQAAEQEIRRVYDTAGATAASQYRIEKTKSQSALINHMTGHVHTFRQPEHAQQALDMVRQKAGADAAQMFDMVVRPTTALRVANVTAWEMLDDKPSPYGTDWRFPFAPFTCFQDTDDVNSVKGVIRDIKDPQREINWHHSTMLDSLIRGPKGGVWIDKSANADVQKLRSEYSRAGFIGEYSGQPPIPVNPQALNEGDMAMLQFGLDAIMRIAGVNAEMLGQTTQKTVSGRAIQSRQSGGLVGIGSLFINWQETKQLVGELLLRRIQQYYPPEKMDRIVGKEHRMLQSIGLFGPQSIPDEQMYQMFKQLKQIDMNIVVDFQDASPSFRTAMASQLMQLKAAGAPVPLQLVIESMDPPFKNEILAELAKQGEQPANPNLAQVVSAGQGQAPTGVNKTT